MEDVITCGIIICVIAIVLLITMIFVEWIPELKTWYSHRKYRGKHLRENYK